jgi:hypothetical protein
LGLARAILDTPSVSTTVICRSVWVLPAGLEASIV